MIRTRNTEKIILYFASPVLDYFDNVEMVVLFYKKKKSFYSTIVTCIGRKVYIYNGPNFRVGCTKLDNVDLRANGNYKYLDKILL